mmetsp:Transcript_23083/g.37189  ORF Transcript_23083/g.37189 Transcript_23083/m.37189 type:complete len:107 (+) Transcript_23083:93-413(+)
MQRNSIVKHNTCPAYAPRYWRDIQDDGYVASFRHCYSESMLSLFFRNEDEIRTSSREIYSPSFCHFPGLRWRWQVRNNVASDSRWAHLIREPKPGSTTSSKRCTRD